MSTPRLPGQAPGSEQEQMIQDAAQHWRNVANEAPVQALARVEEAAKQLIGLTAALQGLYFAVFAFSDLRKQLGSMNVLIPGSMILLLFFIPVPLWLISLYCATRVFVPQVRPGVNLNDVSVGAWQQIKDAYEATVDQKLKWLRRSHVILVVSFAAVLLMLVLLALLLPAPPAAGPTPIIIVTPTPVGTPMPTP